jgi:hypothetical protein
MPLPIWEETWNKLKAWSRWLAIKTLAPGIALILIAGAVLLVCIGFKNIQIGGLLGKLFGKKNPDNRAIDVANSVPKDRVDADGKIIPQGQPDSHGMVQATVVPIKNPGLFSNPDHVEFTPPGESKPTTIVLPDGVKAKDVEHVVVVKPGTFAVTVKDGSGITGKQVDDLLKKYRG